jgi:hypothetical protein
MTAEQIPEDQRDIQAAEATANVPVPLFTHAELYVNGAEPTVGGPAGTQHMPAIEVPGPTGTTVQPALERESVPNDISGNAEAAPRNNRLRNQLIGGALIASAVTGAGVAAVNYDYAPGRSGDTPSATQESGNPSYDSHLVQVGEPNYGTQAPQPSAEAHTEEVEEVKAIPVQNAEQSAAKPAEQAPVETAQPSEAPTEAAPTPSQSSRVEQPAPEKPEPTEQEPAQPSQDETPAQKPTEVVQEPVEPPVNTPDVTEQSPEQGNGGEFGSGEING